MKNILSKTLTDHNGRPTSLGIYRPCTRDWFALREQNLLDLGFASYQQYLQSPLWKSIRSQVYKQQTCCYLCGGEGRVVHHKLYDKKCLSGKNLKQLKLLCLLCHELIHTGEDGKKADWFTVHFQFWVREREQQIRLHREKKAVQVCTC